MKAIDKAKLKSNLDALLALADDPKANPDQRVFQMIESPSSAESIKVIEAWAKEHRLSMVLENAKAYKALEKGLDLTPSPEPFYRAYGVKFLNEQRYIWVLSNYETISPRLLAFYQPMIEKHTLPLMPVQQDITIHGFFFTLGIPSNPR